MSDVVLEFVDVFDKARSAHFCPVKDASFKLCSGERLLVRAQVDTEYRNVLDLALGLEEPQSGQVLFMGRDWAKMNAFEEAEMRGQMGVVFESAGWISSLSVIANIMLRVRHHTLRDDADIRREAEALAAEIGFSDIDDLELRPAVVHRRRLRAYEWVRACMGTPPVILMAFPERGVSSGVVGNLVKMVENRADNGSAVMLISDSPKLFDLVETDKWKIVDAPKMFGLQP